MGGFQNYLEMRVRDNGDIRWRGVLADADWWNAVWNTVRFSVLSVTLETTLGLLVALVLNAEFKGRGFVRAAILIPWAIPTIVSARMWGWMLNDQYGIINTMLMAVGLIDAPIAWTARADTSMIAVLIVDVWKTTPFMALLILAGLQMIPAGHVREREDRRHPPPPGLLPGDAPAPQTRADGGGDLPPARRAADLST
jgi:trehalose/maltose transport system permease protein